MENKNTETIEFETVTLNVEEVKQFIFYLRSYYKMAASARCAFDDATKAIRQGKYSDENMARAVLDGAESAYHAQRAHINDLILVKLRDFFEANGLLQYM